jgi:hypothetical protein
MNITLAPRQRNISAAQRTIRRALTLLERQLRARRLLYLHHRRS